MWEGSKHQISLAILAEQDCRVSYWIRYFAKEEGPIGNLGGLGVLKPPPPPPPPEARVIKNVFG